MEDKIERDLGRFHHPLLPARLATIAATYCHREVTQYCWRIKVERSTSWDAHTLRTREPSYRGPRCWKLQFKWPPSVPSCSLISLFSSKHLIFMRHSNSTSLLFTPPTGLSVTRYHVVVTLRNFFATSPPSLVFSLSMLCKTKNAITNGMARSFR